MTPSACPSSRRENVTVDELAQDRPLVRFEVLTLVRVGLLLAAGFRLEPTGRNPRHFTVAFDDLEAGVERLRNCEHQRWVNPYHEGEPASRGCHMEDLDLIADLNAQDDDGLGWSVLAGARHPGSIRPGSMVLAGNRTARAVVRILAVDDDGQVHFTILPGSVAKNRHLLDLTPA